MKSKLAKSTSIKITNESKPYGFDVERFRMASSIRVTCPVCSDEAERNLKLDYLSYPACNQPFDLLVLCDNCLANDVETIIPVRVNIQCKLELV